MNVKLVLRDIIKQEMELAPLCVHKDNFIIILIK